MSKPYTNEPHRRVLARLKAAALELADVTELLAQVATLTSQRDAARSCLEVDARTIDTLTAERDEACARARDTEEEVAEEVRRAEAAVERAESAESERDALRTQVVRLRQKAEALSRALTPEPENFPSEAALALGALESEVAALPAPTAETKKAPIGDAAWCARAAAREGDLEVAVGPPVETPATEREEGEP